MRRKYLDNIKWITVCLVLIYHVFYMFNSVQPTGVIGPISDIHFQDTYIYLVYPWFMLLLFTVSGMTARYELENKTDKEFMKKRTTRYLVPSTIGLFVFWWVLGYYNATLLGGAPIEGVPGFIKYLIYCFSGTGPLWYIQMLWLFSLVLTWIRKVEKDKLWRFCSKTNTVAVILLAALIYLAGQVLNTPLILVYRFGFYFAGFLIGYFVLSHDEVVAKLEKNWIVCMLLMILAGTAFTVMYYGESPVDYPVMKTVLFLVFAWFGTIGSIAFVKKFGDKENKFTKWMTSKSWGIYVFHYLLVTASAYHLTHLFPNLNALIIYLLVLIVGFGGSIILDSAFRKIPFVRWAVLGIEKKKN